MIVYVVHDIYFLCTLYTFVCSLCKYIYVFKVMQINEFFFIPAPTSGKILNCASEMGQAMLQKCQRPKLRPCLQASGISKRTSETIAFWFQCISGYSKIQTKWFFLEHVPYAQMLYDLSLNFSLLHIYSYKSDKLRFDQVLWNHIYYSCLLKDSNVC